MKSDVLMPQRFVNSVFAYSSLGNVISGIPKGSILGSLPFSISINDLFPP